MHSRLLWTGFQGLDAAKVDLGLAPGGIIPFARNLDPDPESGPARLKDLLDGLQAKWGRDLPLAVALDQEGGAVSRLRPWVGETPSFQAIWEQGGSSACADWGRLWGDGLRMLGFNVDFAPVCDLLDGHEGTGLGNRCASSEPGFAAKAAGAFLHGLESAGVRGCLKHFPGLGGTQVDSHTSLPELEDAAQIERNARPFISLANADRLVMVAHLKTPATGGLPASLHRGSVAGNAFGIKARFLPDDLEMGGCADWNWEERVNLCLEAGHEWLLVCQTPGGARACAEALARQPVGLWSRALERNAAMRANLIAPQPGPLEFRTWKDWVARVRQASLKHQGSSPR